MIVSPVPNTTTHCHLDYETYSEADIKEVGGYKYAADPSTEVMLAAYSFNGGEVRLWDATQDPVMPADLAAAFADPSVQFHAFNAAFERNITKYVLGLDVPTERWHCTMVHAWSLSFSGGLAEVGEQIGLSPDKQKLTDGKKLINRFCKPAPSNHKAERYTSKTHPEEWARFCEYCRQDVVSEQEMETLLVGYPVIPQERALWLLDQRVNDRGLPIDGALVAGAIKIREEEIEILKARMNEITGLSNANSPTQLGAWLATQGVPLPDMTKDTIEHALQSPHLPPSVTEVLQCRQQASKTSVKKWDALSMATMSDGRLRGVFQFGGAQRTQRWAGRIFQPQNLPRPSRDDIDVVASALVPGSRDLIDVVYGNVMEFLSDCIRAGVTAPDGQLLAVCDLGSIESRVLGWESGCTRINQTFANGLDTYKDFATELFNVPYEEVTKHQRFVSKPPTLGCFAGDTPVLTNSGWKPIEEVTTLDLVYDGEEWVGHSGVAYQGHKTVLTDYGVTATPDHLFLDVWDMETWTPWGQLVTKAAKLSETNVYDILNAGPRNRFSIWTEKGAAIVHNCGYRLGGPGLVAYAEGMGVKMTEEEAAHAVEKYRSAYPEVPAMWAWYDGAMKDVIDGGGVREGYAVQISRDDNFMFITLASGRRIAYYKPLIVDRVPPWGGKPRPTITYMGMNQYNRKWERLSTHGGKATEQVTQGLSRDVLGYHMMIVENERPEFSLVGHVHDEMLNLVREQDAERLSKELEQIMSTTPHWAPGLLLGAKGFYTKRYKKD